MTVFSLARLPILALLISLTARGADPRPADDLLRLVPPGVGITIIVEDLRANAPAVLASPLAQSLAQWPAVRAWLGSSHGKQLLQAHRDIETLLGLPLTRVRDDVLGDAAVLALVLPHGERVENARGLLLTRVRDRAVLDRLLTGINAAELREGPLQQVDNRVHQGRAYSLRRFRPNTKPDEAYAILDENIFVWSNSEAIIQGVIDRRATSTDGGLLQEPRVARLAASQPPNALVRALVDPRFLERFVTQPPEKDNPGEAWLRRYLGAADCLGLTLIWRDGPVVELIEHRAPERLDEPLRRWAARSGNLDTLLPRLPANAPIIAAAHLDANAFYDIVLSLIRAGDRPQFDAFLQIAKGLLLGHDLRDDILPALGPSAVGFLNFTNDGTPQAGLLLPLSEQNETTGPAITNALRSLLALTALAEANEKAKPARAIETRKIGDIDVTLLSGLAASPAFAIRPGWLALALGLDSDAVAALLADGPPTCPPWLSTLRADRFPQSETFLAVDLSTLSQIAEQHRDTLIGLLSRDRNGDRDAAARDLDAVLRFARLFRTAYAASTTTADAGEARRAIGLIAAPVESKP